MRDSPPADDPPPTPPVRPSSNDCCRGGCDPCVFELYEEAVERYRVELKAWEARTARNKTDGPTSH